MGGELNQWMVIMHIPQALSMPHNTHEENKEQTNFGHSLVQTQVHHPATRNSSSLDCQGNQQPNMCIKGQKQCE
jgi:hypothetical protein